MKTVRRHTATLNLPTLRLEGGLFLPDVLAKAAHGSARQQTEADYRLPKGLQFKDEIGRAFQIACAQWRSFAPLLERADYDPQHAAATFITELLRDALRVAVVEQGFEASIDIASPTLAQELARTFVTSQAGANNFVLPSEALLAHWLRRAAALSQALPNQAVTAFEHQVQAELAQLAPPVAQNTEVLRMVRQRVGQQAYRQAMLDYWGGACAMTGLALAPVLRASHAKPWAVCESDAERLDVFNGLLLAAHLDALFDQFLLSFDEQGRVLFAPELNTVSCAVLGLSPAMRLRWMAPEHQPYLSYHRQRFMAGH